MPSAKSTTTVPDAAFELWQRLATFPASQTDSALRHLQEWIAQHVGADNVIWIGTARVLHGKPAEADPFLGWRLRDRAALHPDPEPYRKQLAQYFDKEHYGKLSPTYYERSHEAQKEDHVGMDSRATMAGAGHFRAFRIRHYIDFAAFKKTSHYKRYYLHGGVHDRIGVGFPVGPDHESFFLIDRWMIKPRRLFNLQEMNLAGSAIRGAPELHRRLLLGNGLLMGDKLLSPVERKILQGLLAGLTEKDIALSTGQKPSTLHKYVTELYARYGVTSRPALMALWLGT